MIRNDKRINSTGRHSDPNCECTSNNIASKYIKKNSTELKVKTDQQSYLHKFKPLSLIARVGKKINSDIKNLNTLSTYMI